MGFIIYLDVLHSQDSYNIRDTASCGKVDKWTYMIASFLYFTLSDITLTTSSL